MNSAAFIGEVKNLAHAELERRQPAIQARGLRTECELSEWTAHGADNAELRIFFWRQHDFVDVIESFVCRNGQPIATLEELDTWLGEMIDDVLAGQPPGKPG